MAGLTTFVLCVILAPWFILKLKELKIREIAKRDDAPDLDKFQHSKQGTPTMGGIFILASIVISTALWADLGNHYVLLAMFTGVYLAILGGVDDYVKLTHRGPKRGLPKRTKLLWEILLGCFVGSYIYFHPGTSTKLDVPFLKKHYLGLGYFLCPVRGLCRGGDFERRQHDRRP